MKHLSDEQIRELAEKIVSGSDFTRDDELAMLHIAICHECYGLMKCVMAVAEVTDNIDSVAALSKEKRPAGSSPSVSGIIIKIVVLNVSVMLKQLRTETAEWIFDQPFALAGARSGDQEETGIRTVEDIENSENFISFDPKTRTLVIQIDGRDTDGAPRAYLRYSDGTAQTIRFEKREHIFWAEVHDLDNGTYELIIDK